MSSSSSISSSEPHTHSGPTCPVTGAHGFCPAQKGDIRSPCPALNTMANHGYIPRSGKNISAWQIVKGLRECYGLTTPYSIFLSYTTFILLRKFTFRMDLYEIGKHGVVEHDASLVHHDTPEGEKYAPIEIDEQLLEEMDKDAQTIVEEEVEVAGGGKEKRTTRLLSTADVGRARVRREKQSPPLDSLHAEIARGEIGIILGVWEKKVGDKAGAPADWIKRWLGEERLPDDWKATPRSFGLSATRKRTKEIKAATEAIRAKEAAEAAAKPDNEKA